jgi:Ca2+-binding EF-hand superfamily protein
MKAFLLASALVLAASAFGQSSSPPQNNGSDSTAGAAQQAPRQTMKQRFMSANTNHDGHLTRSEAVAMPMVSRHFDEIDTSHAGYVTMEEIRAWHQKMHATHQGGGHQQSGASSMPSDASDQDAN